MGGEQAASVLATVKRDQMAHGSADRAASEGIPSGGGLTGAGWSTAEEEAFKAPIREQYERQGHPYYASARLWDDGVIDPADTRRVLSLCLAAVRNAPERETRFGLFRM
jgi:3-methylcrotonyl-CoA carboxylase beta subunit